MLKYRGVIEVTFIVILYTLLTLTTQSAFAARNDSSVLLANILRPYVYTLDRDLWTFRYEAKDSFQPQTVSDLIDRIGPRTERFYDINVLSGADTGPGVYVAVDPVATATWGRINPRMFAIKIKRGTKVLAGDKTPMDVTTIKSLNQLTQDLNCGRSSTSKEFDLGNSIGFFRMNDNPECRQVVISAIQQLNVMAITYGFNSAPLKDCRTTGTAISIINRKAISLEEINWYSEDGNIEGQPEITPFVKRLFTEAQGDFYSQSLLANLEVWHRYKKAYGFFDDVNEVDRKSYQNWKEMHLFQCGPKWSIESVNPQLERINQLRVKAEPLIKDLLIKMALIYRNNWEEERLVLHSKNIPAELRIEKIRILAEKYRNSFSNKVRLTLGLTPITSYNSTKDKLEYLETLKYCLHKYETQPFIEVVDSDCGVEPD